METQKPHPMLNCTIEEKIKEFFQEDEQTLAKIFNQLFAHICSTEYGKTDLYYLSKKLSFQQLEELTNYYDGDVIRMPTKEELHICYLLSVCYFLKEEMNWNWSQIKHYLKLEGNEYFSSIAFGKKILTIKDNIKKDLRWHLKMAKKEKLDEILGEVREWLVKKK